MLPVAANALTWFKAFKPQCLYLAGACLLIGSCTGGTAGWKVASWKASKEIGALELKIEQRKTEDAKALTDAANREIEIRDEVRRELEPKREAVEALADAVRNLGHDVRVCSSTSRLQISSPTPGTVAASTGEQSRAGETVLRELVETIAKRCDDQANLNNALIQWATAQRAD